MGAIASGVKRELADDLSVRLQRIEDRIAALEQRSQAPLEADAPLAPAPITKFAAESWAAPAAKCLLFLAGAYLIRALSESGPAQHRIALWSGLAYALLGILWAARQSSTDRFAAALYSSSAMITFSGLLWENAAASNFLSAPASALLLALYVWLGQLLAGRFVQPVIGAIVTPAGSALAVVLLIATHAVVPFCVALLVIAATSEFQTSGHRWLPAAAADFALLIATWLLTLPKGLPPGYVPYDKSAVVALQMALLVLYFGAMVQRTLSNHAGVGTFEVLQTAFAVALLTGGALALGSRASAFFCIAAGLLAYGIALRFCAGRDHVFYGLFGLALLGAGSLLAFSGLPLVLAWCALGVTASWLGTQEHHLSLQLHAPVFLAAAAFAHGPHAVAVLLATLALAFAYFLVGPGGAGFSRVPSLLLAGLLLWLLLQIGLAAIPAHGFVAGPLRIGVLCFFALALAAAARRFQASQTRPECVWLVYPLMVYGAYLLSTLVAGHHPTALALGLLCYGGTLLLLSRRPASSAVCSEDGHDG